MKCLRPRFSVRRLLMAIALFAGLLMAMRPLAGIGKMYEEQAILYVFAPPDWAESDAPQPKLTDKHLREYARRLVAPEVLDGAAALLNEELDGRNDEPKDPFQPRPARPYEMVPTDLPVPAMSDPDLMDRIINPPHWMPTRAYAGSDLAGRLRTQIVRPPAVEPFEHLARDAIVLSASSHSQGEAKAFALTVVAAYSKKVGLAYASPAGAGEGFTVRPPFLDRPWKVASAFALAAAISSIPLFLPGHRESSRPAHESP